MITKQQRETIGQLIEAKATALAELNQSDFASEIKAYAAFSYVRASDRLEAYLNSLVAEETTTAAEGAGWIKWGGGECPVPAGTWTEVKFKGMSSCVDDSPEGWDWEKMDHPGCIIAYRIVGPRTNTN